MRFKRIALILLFLANLCVGVVYAHPVKMLHTKDLVYSFEGFNAFYGLADQINERIDNLMIDGVKLSPKNHRDLFHPLFFGEAIPNDLLDSVAKTYARGVFKQQGIEISIEEAKRNLMKARATYLHECTALVQKMTGLPRKEAQALAGCFHIAHLLGDIDPLDNTITNAIPEVDRLSRALERHLDVLFKRGTGGRAIREWLSTQKVVLRELRQSYGGDSVGHSIALRRYLAQESFGEMLDKNWGGTLAKHGIYFDETFAKQCAREADEAFYWEGRLRKGKWLQDPKRFAKSLQKSPVNMTYKTTRRLNRARQAAVVQATKKGSSLIIRPGVMQTMRSATGEIVEVLTVPIQQAGKGLAVGSSAGILTFVFSQGTTYAMYQKGVISEDEFIAETEKNCGAALTTGATTFVLVALGANPAGWVVLGVGATVDAIYGLTFDEVQWVQSFDWEKDWIFGEVPTEIQRRTKLFEGTHDGLFSFPKRTTLLNAVEDPEIRSRTTILNWENDPEIRIRTTILNWENDPEIRERGRLPF